MDWNLARSRQSPALTAHREDTIEVHCQPGGAAMLGDLIGAVARQLRADELSDLEVDTVAVPAAGVTPGDARFQHSYALWSQYPADRRGSGGAKVWRVDEFLGLERRRDEWLAPETGAEAGASVVERDAVSGRPGDADLVVLDDANLGFRDHPELWPAFDATSDHRPWIVLKMAAPVARGALFERLVEDWAERLVVVMTINDLRLSEVQVSRELSWERTAQDLVWELVQNEQVNALARCAHVVVSFKTDGVLLLSSRRAAANESKTVDARLFFDPAGIEGMWALGHPGATIGQTGSLTAAIARQVMLAPKMPDIGHGIQRGLTAMRTLHLEGYGDGVHDGEPARLAFPSERIAAELARDGEPFAEARVKDPLRTLTLPAAAATRGSGPHFWTILEDRYRSRLRELGRQIVVEGGEVVLAGVPLGQFGRLLTVDRHEIESFRSIRSLIVEYSRDANPERPLSIAVFGPPGSGKSFGIVEVATAALPDRVEALTFNLSQFNSPAQLIDALHQVRDVGLTGKLPLVFWDEFDTELDGQKLGWLRRFLAPMQDGAFQENQISHPVGPAIFVFAGGTCERMEQFGSQLGDDRFRDVKGPDFVSRLKGYVDILGPNPSPNAASDPYFVVRRAILLRTMLLRDKPQLFHRANGRDLLSMDPGVLRAFLETRRYRHGARSIESILAMSLLAGKQQFDRSSLPAEAQLSLHVDAEDFLALVRWLDLEGPLLERLAEAAHVVHCAGLLRSGHTWGEPGSDYLRGHALLAPYADDPGDGSKTRQSLVAYERLPEENRDQSRDLVRDIPRKLAQCNYVMRPVRGGDEPFNFPLPELELLAEAEHDRWVLEKLETGWSYGPVDDHDRLLHPSLLPWRQLSPEERADRYGPQAGRIGPGELSHEDRDKNRDLVRGVPQILAAAGYTIVKLSEREPNE